MPLTFDGKTAIDTGASRGGLSQDFPLAAALAANRTLRFADGSDEVHKHALARYELRRQATARARAAVPIPTGPVPSSKETP